MGVGEGGGVGRAAREGVHVKVRGKFMNKLVRLTAFAYSNSIYRLSDLWWSAVFTLARQMTLNLAIWKKRLVCYRPGRYI